MNTSNNPLFSAQVTSNASSKLLEPVIASSPAQDRVSTAIDAKMSFANVFRLQQEGEVLSDSTELENLTGKIEVALNVDLDKISLIKAHSEPVVDGTMDAETVDYNDKIDKHLAASIAVEEPHLSEITSSKNLADFEMAAIDAKPDDAMPGAAEPNNVNPDHLRSTKETILDSEQQTPLTSFLAPASSGKSSSISTTEKPIQTKSQLINSSPIAGSPDKQSDEIQQSNRSIDDIEFVATAESGLSPRGGNFIPPNGKTLPGNLPFFANAIETSQGSSHGQDFMSRAIVQGQTSVQGNDPQATLPQLAQSEPSLTAPNQNLDLPQNIHRAVPALSPGVFSAGAVVGDTAVFTIDTPAGSVEWSNQIGNKVRWMTTANISSAEMRLNPAELGSIEVRITTEDDQTKVSFVASNAVTKDIIELSLPRLRDLLDSAGLQLEHSDVSQRSLSENSSGPEETNKGGIDSEANTTSEEASLLVTAAGPNQIDHYV